MAYIVISNGVPIRVAKCPEINIFHSSNISNLLVRDGEYVLSLIREKMIAIAFLFNYIDHGSRNPWEND